MTRRDFNVYMPRVVARGNVEREATSSTTTSPVISYENSAVSRTRDGRPTVRTLILKPPCFIGIYSV